MFFSCNTLLHLTGMFLTPEDNTGNYRIAVDDRFAYCKRVVLLGLMVMLTSLTSAYATHFKKVVVITSGSPSAIESNILELLCERVKEKSRVRIFIRHTGDEPLLIEKDPGTLQLFWGIAAGHAGIKALCFQNRIPPLTEQNPGPEGFLLKYFPERKETPGKMIVAGVDNRGLLYAVGAFLRESRLHAEKLEMDQPDIRSAPAFEVRGTQYGQSHVALEKAKVRRWTKKDKERAILDLALAGANTFFVDRGTKEEESEDIRFLKSYDLMICSTFLPNAIADKDYPREWRAFESIGRESYICPSVPEARAYILKECERHFSNSPAYDFIQLKGGDGGGCECDRCYPYGKTFIHLCEEIAGIIHRYHPRTRLYFTNQKFDNESDVAILDYLNEKPREWLWAWGYGPGSDATTWQPGHRQNHRMDLFRYPGFGPYGLYPKELLHQLPGRHKILYFNEITHWKYSQHGYIQMYPRADKDGNQPPAWSHEIYERRPDQTLTMVYDRLSFFAWPKYYHRVFNDLMPYGAGDITHSSGNHDHFNQWMWQRLLWNPRMSVAGVVNEYSTNWFGREAAPLMTKAILQLESNMEELENEPLQDKKGINTYYTSVQQAGRLIPANLMKDNWLWRMYMQKGALDAYIRLDLIQQLATKHSIEQRIIANRKNIKWNDLTGLIDHVLKNETPEMIRLRKEASRLGEESNDIFGTRSEAIFNLRHDYIGLGWLKRQLERAERANSETQRGELLDMITDYEGRKVHALYDNLGTGNAAPHVVAGYPYDHGQPYVSTMLSEENRPSQRSMHFTQDEDQGVTLLYTDLAPGRDYTLRLTLVRPTFQERYADRMKQKTESVYANNKLLAENIELPENRSDFFTFEIPSSCIKEGVLEIRLMKDATLFAGDKSAKLSEADQPADHMLRTPVSVETEQWRNTGGWGTLLSEAWLIPRQQEKQSSKGDH